MTEAEQIVRLVVLTVAVGVAAQVIAETLRLPSILLLLLSGLAMGPQGAAWIDPGLLGPGLEAIVSLCVALILFDGSLHLNLRHLREVQVSVRRLVTSGFAITFGLASTAAHVLAEVPWAPALVFGALVSVTGPTVIHPILRRVRLRREVSSILEGEGILADPIGAILAVVCLEYALEPAEGLAAHLAGFGERLVIGTVAGGAVGLILAVVVRIPPARLAEMKNLVVLACALGAYAAAEAYRPESGLVAAVAAGLTAQLGMRRRDRELREFGGQLTTLFLSFLFVLLAANLDLEAMRREGIPGLATVLAVMLVVRPVNIFWSTRGGKPTFREKLFLSWTAPRGIVAASVASLAAIKLGSRGIATGERIEALVFMTVFLTVIVQGATAGPVAWLLGILAHGEGRLVVIGANRLARAVALIVQKTGREVVVVDTNPYHCERARAAGLEAICGSATNREVLEEADLADAGALVACTESAKVNEMIALVARQEYDVREVSAVIDADERDRLDPMLERQGVRLAFGRPIPMDTWMGGLQEEAARVDGVPVTKANLPGDPLGTIPFPDRVVPIAVRRADHILIAAPDLRLKEGDTVYLLVRGVSRETLEATLGVPPPGAVGTP